MVDINNSLWSTIDASNSANSPNGYNSSTTPANVIAIQQAAMGATKRLWERIGPALTSTGSVNNYIVTPTNAAYPSALVQGDVYTFIASFANTGAATLTYNGLAPIQLRKVSSTGLTALAGGEIQSGQTVSVGYNGSIGQILSETARSTTSGSVTSVGMAGDGTVFNSAVTGSPVTSSGTLTPSLKTQAAHLALIGPASGAGAPTFRVLALGDLPTQTGTGNIVLSASPALTGIPTAPTAAPGTNTTQIATMAALLAAVGGTLQNWTPSLQFGGASTGITYTLQSGKYIQFGKLIVADFNMTLTSKGSATGSATLTGFPVASLANTATSVIISAYQNMSSITGSMVTNLSSTTATLAQGGATGQDLLTDANFNNTTIFGGVAIYFTT